MQRLAAGLKAAGPHLRRRRVGWLWGGFCALLLVWWFLASSHGFLIEVGDAVIRPPRLAVEAAILIGALGFLIGRPGLPRIVAGADPRAFTLAVLLVVGTALTQFGLLGTQHYPLATWTMYTSPTAQITYTDLVMVRGDEELGQLPFARAVPTRSPRALLWPVTDVAEQAAQGDRSAEVRLEEWVAVVTAHPGVLPDDAAQRPDTLRIDRCAVRDPSQPGAVACSTLLEVPIPPPAPGAADPAAAADAGASEAGAR
ncbi:MAG: hypothetical protein JJT89_00960 [Nitriliruptoraceae bacterium]|nr:hypothetical protein [Nitriliruptoraceae bacterium]